MKYLLILLTLALIGCDSSSSSTNSAVNHCSTQTELETVSMDGNTSYLLMYNECNDILEFTVQGENKLIHLASYDYTWAVISNYEVLNEKIDGGWIEYQITSGYIYIINPIDGDWMVYPDDPTYTEVLSQVQLLIDDVEDAVKQTGN